MLHVVGGFPSRSLMYGVNLYGCLGNFSNGGFIVCQMLFIIFRQLLNVQPLSTKEYNATENQVLVSRRDNEFLYSKR